MRVIDVTVKFLLAFDCRWNYLIRYGDRPIRADGNGPNAIYSRDLFSY